MTLASLRLAFVATAISGAFLAATPALAAPNYDCSKAGNANKTACKAKAAAPAAPAAAKPAVTKVTAPAAPAAAKATRPMTYDCSKAGNANKAACKAAPAAAVPAARPAAPAAPVTASRAVYRAPASSPAPASQAGNAKGTWTQKNGKVVHYDCSKAGNLNKQACK